MSLRIVIIGGVAGGMSAATRARRVNEKASITVLEKGGYVSFANCGMPYHIAGRIASAEKLLLTNPGMLARRFNIDARVRHEVIAIDRAAKTVTAVDHASGQSITLPYDKLIIATGADAIVPPIDHVTASNVFFLRSMEDTSAVQAFIQQKQPKTAAVVGGGFIGLEMAEALRDRGLQVSLIEKAPHVLPVMDEELAIHVENELRAHEVKLFTNVGIKNLIAAADQRTAAAVELEDGQKVPADMVLLSIGVRPNVRLAREAGLTIGASGAIAVDEYQRTSDPDVYAVGDASEVVHGASGARTRIPLAGPANRQGRLAGEHAATGQSSPAGRVFGTAIVQVFGLAAGITGLSEREARRQGLEFDTAYVLPNHHAGYYPGAQQMRLKLVYERTTGRVLGAQAVGPAGIDKRLDVVATAMHFRGTIHDLTELDLSYAPQFGSAKDPIHFAAFVAQNQQRGLTPSAGPEARDGRLLLDVRTPQECAGGMLPGAVNIPIDELRKRLGELEPRRPTLVYCQVGMRGHIATRILRQHGFADVKNLKGGYALWKQMVS